MAVAVQIRGHRSGHIGSVLALTLAFVASIPDRGYAAEQPDTRVTSGVTVQTADSKRPKVTAKLTVDLPDHHGDVKALRGDVEDSAGYSSARRRFLSGYGLFPFDVASDPDSPVHTFYLVDDLRTPPKMRPAVGGGRAVSTVSASTELAGCCLSPGHWTVNRTDDGLRLSIHAHRIPDDVSWEVTVDAGPHELGGLEPRPASTKGHIATWMLAPTDRPVDVRADIELKARQRLTLTTETGRWAIAQPVGWGLGHAAFFLLLLLVLRSPLPPPVRARRRLAAYCAFACAVVAAAWAGSIVLAEQSPAPVATGAFDRLSIAVWARAALPLGCFGVGALVLARLGLRWPLPLLAALGASLAAAAAVAWLLGARQFATAPNPGLLPWKLGDTWPSVFAIALVASTAAFTWLFLAIAVRVVWPGRSEKRLPRLALAGLLILVVGCVAQWVWWVWTVSDTTAQQFDAGFLDSGPADFGPVLEWHALIYPIDLGTTADDLLVVIGFGIAVHWLRLQARRTDTSVFLPDTRNRVLLAGMLAVTLGSAGDVLLGVPVPLGVVVIFAGILALLRWNSRRVAVLQSSAASLDETRRVRMLLNHGLTERVQRSRREAYAQYAEGTIDGAEYERQYGRSAGALRLIGDSASQALALGLGPGRSWWENGIHATKAGALIGLAPGVLYVVLSLNQVHWFSFGPYAPFGFAWLVTLVVSEIAFWLAISFAFGCLYAHLPGRNGAIKGFWLGAIVGVIGVGYLVLPFDRDVLSPGYGIVEMLLFFVLLGMALDWLTLRERHVYWRHLLDHYAATRLQFALGYAVPILVSTAILLQQIVTGNHAESLGGDAQASLAEAIRSVPTRGR